MSTSNNGNSSDEVRALIKRMNQLRNLTPDKVNRDIPVADSVEKTIDNLQSRWNLYDKIPNINSSSNFVRDHEITRTFLELGNTPEYSATAANRPPGVFGPSTARAVLREEMGIDFDTGKDKYREKREQLREKFIEDAYELAFKIIKEMTKDEKLKAAPLKDLATSLGIIMDKVLIASGKFEERRTMEFTAIAQMNDENLEQFVRQTEGAISFLSQRSASATSTWKPEESS